MRYIETYRHKLQDLLSEDKTSKVIESLKDQINRESSIFNEIISLRGRIKNLEKEKRNGIISNSEARQENIKIQVSLIEIINELKEEDLGIYKSYFERIKSNEEKITKLSKRLLNIEDILSKTQKHILNLEE